MTSTPRDDSEPAAGWAGRVMVLLRAVTQLVAVNLLVLAGTLVGGVLLGLFPALAAGGALVSRVAAGDPPDHVWHEFWAAYRASWRRLNVLGAPFWVGGTLLGLDVLVLTSAPGGVPPVLWVGVAGLGAYGTLALAFLLPAARRSPDGALRIWRFAALAPLVSPAAALAVLVTLATVTFAMVQITVLLPLVGLSLPLLLTGWIVGQRLDALDARTAQADPAAARAVATSDALPAVDSRTTIA